MPAALAHIRQLLAVWPPEGLTLAQLTAAPELAGGSAQQRRAGLASTLLARLELAREGALGLDQKASFEEIRARAPWLGER